MCKCENEFANVNFHLLTLWQFKSKIALIANFCTFKIALLFLCFVVPQIQIPQALWDRM